MFSVRPALLLTGVALIAVAPLGLHAQDIRYMKSGAAGLQRSVQSVDDTNKLVEAGALTEMPNFACPIDGGEKIVLLNRYTTDYRDDGTNLIVWRVKVVSGRSKGCIGYTLPSMFQRSPPKASR